jgi:hypothetical protein
MNECSEQEILLLLRLEGNAGLLTRDIGNMSRKTACLM